MGSKKHALVFGASGISGNTLCNEILGYPSKDTFAKVTGLTNRPLSIQDAQLPEDPRLQLISGIDLTRDVETVKKELEKKVKDIHEVTHVFFMGIRNPIVLTIAYIEKKSYEELVPVNVALLKTAVTAVDALAPNLEHVILQTGGKVLSLVTYIHVLMVGIWRGVPRQSHPQTTFQRVAPTHPRTICL